MMDWAAAAPAEALMRPADAAAKAAAPLARPNTAASSAAPPAPSAGALAAAPALAAAGRGKGVHGMVPVFARADSGDTASSGAGSPPPDDDLEHAVPQSVSAWAEQQHDEARLRGFDADAGADSDEAEAAAPAAVSRRRRVFAAPPCRAPALAAAAAEAGLVFTLGLAAAHAPRRVVKRNYRSRRAGMAGRRRRTAAARREALASMAPLPAGGVVPPTAATATATATATTARKAAAAGKRLRDRSSLRKPQRDTDADSDDQHAHGHSHSHGYAEDVVDADVDMALSGAAPRAAAAAAAAAHDAASSHSASPSAAAASVASAATPASLARATPTPSGSRKAAGSGKAKAAAAAPRASPVQYPPSYVSAGPGKPRKQKQCACCGTTSTPLWRDIGRKLPLCNACGIRYKKYGLICPSCNYVPCKQERASKSCRRCSTKLPPASTKARMPINGEAPAAGAPQQYQPQPQQQALPQPLPEASVAASHMQHLLAPQAQRFAGSSQQQLYTMQQQLQHLHQLQRPQGQPAGLVNPALL